MNSGNCFVCGQKNDAGLKLVFTTDPNSRSAECTAVLTDRYCGWAGLVHGGVMAAILDDAMGHACKSMGLNCLTAELTIRYKKPVPANSEIRIKARVTDQQVFMSYNVLYTEAVVELDKAVVIRAEAKMFVGTNLL